MGTRKKRLIGVTAPGAPERDQINYDDEAVKTIFYGKGHDAPRLNVGGHANALVTNLQEQLDNDLARIEELEDDRLLVLVAALYVENALEKLLRSLLPGYDELQDNKEFTFSLKIALVRSLRIIPLKLLNNADFIRKVRNTFVHDLSKGSFTDLGDRYLQSMRDRASEYHPKFYNAKGPNDAFKLLSYCTVAGIYSLTNETALLNDFLRSPESLFAALQAFLDEGWHV